MAGRPRGTGRKALGGERGSTLERPRLAKDDQLLIDGEIVVVVAADELSDGFNLVVRTPAGQYRDAFIRPDQASSLRLAAGDGGGQSASAITAVWAQWMGGRSRGSAPRSWQPGPCVPSRTRTRRCSG